MTSEIRYRSSIDGVNWSSIKTTGTYAVDTPGLACRQDYDCQLTYMRASADSATLLNHNQQRGFNELAKLHRLQQSVGYGTRSCLVGTGEGWQGIYHSTTSGSWIGRHWGSFYSNYGSVNPLSGTSHTLVGESSEHPAKFAGNLAFGESYIFYVD